MWVAKQANVHSGPSTNHEVLDLLEVGTRIYVVGKIGNWLKLRTIEGQPENFVYAPLLVGYDPTESVSISYKNGDIYQGTTIAVSNAEESIHASGSRTKAISYGKRRVAGSTMGHGNATKGVSGRQRTGRGFSHGRGRSHEGDFVIESEPVAGSSMGRRQSLRRDLVAEAKRSRGLPWVNGNRSKAIS